MKKLKKLSALLLACVMVLALFTACSGGGTSEEEKAEAAVMTTINGNRAVATYGRLENNAQRRKVATQNIDLVAKNGFGPLSSDVKFTMDTDHIKDGKFGFTFVAKYDYKNTNLQDLVDKITKGGGNIKSNYVDKWSDVGVVVKTVNGQTYIAVSVAIDTRA